MSVRARLNSISLSNRFSSFFSRCCLRFSCLGMKSEKMYVKWGLYSDFQGIAKNLLRGMLKTEALHGLLGLRDSSLLHSSLLVSCRKFRAPELATRTSRNLAPLAVAIHPASSRTMEVKPITRRLAEGSKTSGREHGCLA